MNAKKTEFFFKFQFTSTYIIKIGLGAIPNDKQTRKTAKLDVSGIFLSIVGVLT